jgi:hypothetical protein
MIVVTGTKRSGTSLWMRMLIEGGLNHIGDAFPGVWGESIRDANPHGFYESRLRRGVFFATNPDPKTGAYIPSDATTHHALKVFIPGVVRSERAYLHRVVATMRHWRAFARSLHALQQSEEDWYRAHPEDGLTGEQMVEKIRRRRSRLPAPIEWFLENYELVRDFAVRRYPINFTTYDRLLDEPDATVRRVFDWIGVGDPEAALKAIEPELKRSDSRPPVASEAVVDSEHIRLFDDFYAAIHERSSVPKSLVPELNAAWTALMEQYQRRDARRVADAATGALDDGPQTR